MAAQSGGESEARCAHCAIRAGQKLLAARALRPTPFIDRTLYTGWNAMAVTAYLETARVLRMDEAREVCAADSQPAADEAWDGTTTLATCDRLSRWCCGRRRSAPGTLDDYAFTVHACIDAWLASGEMKFYRAAVQAGRRDDRAVSTMRLLARSSILRGAQREPAEIPLGA